MQEFPQSRGLLGREWFLARSMLEGQRRHSHGCAPAARRYSGKSLETASRRVQTPPSQVLGKLWLAENLVCATCVFTKSPSEVFLKGAVGLPCGRGLATSTERAMDSVWGIQVEDAQLPSSDSLGLVADTAAEAICSRTAASAQFYTRGAAPEAAKPSEAAEPEVDSQKGTRATRVTRLCSKLATTAEKRPRLSQELAAFTPMVSGTVQGRQVHLSEQEEEDEKIVPTEAGEPEEEHLQPAKRNSSKVGQKE
eukprot:1213815-Amphidinium_carterae.1